VNPPLQGLLPPLPQPASLISSPGTVLGHPPPLPILTVLLPLTELSPRDSPRVGSRNPLWYPSATQWTLLNLNLPKKSSRPLVPPGVWFVAEVIAFPLLKNVGLAELQHLRARTTETLLGFRFCATRHDKMLMMLLFTLLTFWVPSLTMLRTLMCWSCLVYCLCRCLWHCMCQRCCCVCLTCVSIVVGVCAVVASLVTSATFPTWLTAGAICDRVRNIAPESLRNSNGDSCRILIGTG